MKDELFTTGYKLGVAKFLSKLICAMCFYPQTIGIVDLGIFFFYKSFHSQSDSNKNKDNENKMLITIIT